MNSNPTLSTTSSSLHPLFLFSSSPLFTLHNRLPVCHLHCGTPLCTQCPCCHWLTACRRVVNIHTIIRRVLQGAACLQLSCSFPAAATSRPKMLTADIECKTKQSCCLWATTKKVPDGTFGGQTMQHDTHLALLPTRQRRRLARLAAAVSSSLLQFPTRADLGPAIILILLNRIPHQPMLFTLKSKRHKRDTSRRCLNQPR